MDQQVEPVTIEVEFPVDDRPLSHGVPARSLAGLPLARAIPQDVHSIIDYATALGVAVAGFFAGARRARIGCGVIGGVGLVQSLVSDYRLSAIKFLPIELHEARDYVWGGINLAAPFVLGYRKRERVASIVQIAAGATIILAALFTDYRGWKRRHIGFLRRSDG